MLAPGLVWMGTALWLLGKNPSMSQILGALFPLGSAPDPVSNRTFHGTALTSIS